jgi:hypothetical protein
MAMCACWQKNEIDSATTTLATKMVAWLSPLTQAVGKNILSDLRDLRAVLTSA